MAPAERGGEVSNTDNPPNLRHEVELGRFMEVIEHERSRYWPLGFLAFGGGRSWLSSYLSAMGKQGVTAVMATNDRLRAAQESVDVAQEALHDATTDRDAAVQAAYRNGVPVHQIAAELGVHRQIVYRIIRRAQV